MELFISAQSGPAKTFSNCKAASLLIKQFVERILLLISKLFHMKSAESQKVTRCEKHKVLEKRRRTKLNCCCCFFT